MAEEIVIPQPILRIVRGLPGSGKSTYARKFGGILIESDMALYTGDQYIWTPERLDKAINWVRAMFQINVQYGNDINLVGVFTREKNFRHHIEFAEKNGYKVEVIRCTADYGNIHNVPQESLDRMARTLEPFEGEIIVSF